MWCKVTTEPIRRLAADQHGIISRSQLLNAGVHPRTIDHWIKTGRLIVLHRGVFALGHLPPSPHARTMAAVLACGPRAVLSHHSAAQLWGLIRYTGAIHITARTTRARPGLIVHRKPLSDHEVTTHYGIPTASAARTLTDLARTLSPAALTRAVNVARIDRRLNMQDLPAKMRPTHAPTRSAFEDAFLRFCARHHLARPEVNTFVAGYEVDMLWRPQRLIAELDGEDYHEHFHADREKDADLLAAGHRVIRVTWERLTERPGPEARRFRALLG
jgi:very-short-patch-repair endonuclease